MRSQPQFKKIDNCKYGVKLIWDNMVYMRESKNQLPDLKYLVL